MITLFALSTAAHASVMLAMDFPALVHDADHIVVGTVESQVSRWDERGRIVTDVTLRVEETMKGDRGTGETLVVTHAGGAIGEVGAHIEGEARFYVGERALVFGANARSVRPFVRTVGMSQGVFEIRATEANPGVDMVMPSGVGLALMQRVQNSRLLPAPPALIEPRALSQLRTELRAIIEASRAR